MTKTRVPLSGKAATTPQASTPTETKRPDGQYTDHWVLPEEERAKGYVRPVRYSYQHVGATGPVHPLRELTEEELERYGKFNYFKFEVYPEDQSPITGRYWTQQDLAKVGRGCGAVTTMPQAIAETYARQPRYYGSTFCCGCGKYLPVGKDGEFVWDGTAERVGT